MPFSCAAVCVKLCRNFESPSHLKARRLRKGAYIYDVHRTFGIFYPLPLFVSKFYMVCTQIGGISRPLPLSVWTSYMEASSLDVTLIRTQKGRKEGEQRCLTPSEEKSLVLPRTPFHAQNLVCDRKIYGRYYGRKAYGRNVLAIILFRSHQSFKMS